MSPVSQQNWQQFVPDSPNYLGAQGIGIPPWMQSRFGSADPSAPQTGSDQASGGQTSFDPTQSSATRGAMKWGAANGNSNIKPQWFTDFENQQNQQSYMASAPPVNPAQPPATVTPPGPTTQPNVGAAPPPPATDTPQPPPSQDVAPPAVASNDQQGIGLPPVSQSSDKPPSPASPQAPNPNPPPSQPSSAAGQGVAVINGWYHDNNPTGGTPAGEVNGQPIYYHYGYQSPEDQFNSQFPDRAATPQVTSTSTTTPAVTSTSTPASTSTPDPGAYTIAPNAGTTPEALGGTQSTADWVANQQELAAGFGSDIPEALGGTKKMARGGAVRGYANGGAVNHPMGLVHAARQLESYGRGPDTSLAHISPDESKMLDYLQGGRKTNPATGLSEYSLFGDILKAVARVGAATVGFMYGGPLGAAAGSAAATKLTGGSWKDAAISGGLSGLTAGIGNVAGGSSAFASGNSLAASAASGVNGMSDAAIAAGAPAGASAAGSSFGQTLAQGVKYLGTAPGLSLAATSGLGAFNHAADGSNTPPPGWQGPGTTIPNTYDPKNLPSWYAPGQLGKKPLQGGIPDPNTDGLPLDPTDPEYASKLSQQYAGVPAMADGGPVGMGAPPQALLQAANWGYVNAAQGGSIHGPGDGKSDDIPAQLSADENVWDAGTVADAGNGSSEAGHKVMQEMKEEVRRQAGRKNPKEPSGSMGFLVAKAKRRAGVGA